MKENRLRRLFYAAMCALILAVMLPVTAVGQRRWVVVRPHRSRVVVYNYQRAYTVYQQPNYSYRTYTYGYSQPYYSNQYYSQPYYSNSYYSNPYYSNQNYSYRNTQPYFANRYTYSWANPTYRYDYSDYGYYRPRRHNRARVGIWFR